MREAVLIEGVRTPFGRPGKVLRAIPPVGLLSHALKGLVARAGIEPVKIDDVLIGCVTQSGDQGANIARLGVLLSGFPVNVPAASLNRWCGSSQQAVHYAAQEIIAGDADYAIAGGVEHSTSTPLYSDIGGLEKLNPDLLEVHELVHQGESGERIGEKYNITREDADAYSMESHRRASQAAREQKNSELLETIGSDRKGRPIAVLRDEGIRDEVDPSIMSRLPTKFRGEDGILTAGNSSPFADGASAVLVANREAAIADGFRPKARFRARVVVGDDPILALAGVIPATRKALKKAGVAMTDLDWIEINEAFSTVVLAWQRVLNADPEKVNPWGGAIAHGHPLGATGAGLLAKMMAGLEATDGSLGLEVICIGHGQATATIIERI